MVKFQYLFVQIVFFTILHILYTKYICLFYIYYIYFRYSFHLHNKQSFPVLQPMTQLTSYPVFQIWQ
jgi:hypothetical protein